MNRLLNQRDISSEELEGLLKERAEGREEFLLVDVREDREFQISRLRGVDLLKPTSKFQNWVDEFLKETKDKIVILTCRTGNRSGQLQDILTRRGHPHVINHVGGIVSYRGEIEKG